MAENKKGFVLYADTIHVFEALENDEAGKLIKHILRYVNDLDPQTDDKLIKIAFEPIKQQLKRDLKKYEGIKQKRSEYGKQGGANSAEAKRSKTKQNEAKASKGEANEAVIDTVIVTDTVKDTVTVTDIVNTKKENLIEYFFSDLENSSAFETIAMRSGLTKDGLLPFLDKFRMKAELSYPSFDRFVSHFKNFVVNEKLKPKKNESKQFTANAKSDSLSELAAISLDCLNQNNSGNG